MRPPHILSEIVTHFSNENPLETRSPWRQAPPKRLVVLDRHVLPTLVTPGFQHEPAAAGLHAFAESVGFCAPAIVRLVRSLWHPSVLLENFKSNTVNA